MGFPSFGKEGIYRNNAEDVRQFLDSRHRNNYKIYNLCPTCERSYDPSFFYNRVKHFPFDDHNPPPMTMFAPFCEDATSWLLDSEDNVVVIHCKAGKGRTGVMVCALLLYIGKFMDPDACVSFYGERRTNNGKGVTIPSQRRFIKYFSELCREVEHENPDRIAELCAGLKFTLKEDRNSNGRSAMSSPSVTPSVTPSAVSRTPSRIEMTCINPTLDQLDLDRLKQQQHTVPPSSEQSIIMTGRPRPAQLNLDYVTGKLLPRTHSDLSDVSETRSQPSNGSGRDRGIPRGVLDMLFDDDEFDDDDDDDDEDYLVRDPSTTPSPRPSTPSLAERQQQLLGQREREGAILPSSPLTVVGSLTAEILAIGRGSKVVIPVTGSSAVQGTDEGKGGMYDEGEESKENKNNLDTNVDTNVNPLSKAVLRSDSSLNEERLARAKSGGENYNNNNNNSCTPFPNPPANDGDTGMATPPPPPFSDTVLSGSRSFDERIRSSRELVLKKSEYVSQRGRRWSNNYHRDSLWMASMALFDESVGGGGGEGEGGASRDRRASYEPTYDNQSGGSRSLSQEYDSDVPSPQNEGRDQDTDLDQPSSHGTDTDTPTTAKTGSPRKKKSGSSISNKKGSSVQQNVDGDAGEPGRRLSYDLASPHSSRMPRRGELNVYKPMCIQAIWVYNFPKNNFLGGFSPIFKISCRSSCLNSETIEAPVSYSDKSNDVILLINNIPDIPVADEFLIKCYNKQSFRSGSIFQFWLHTAFITDSAIILSKAEIDKCCKDKDHSKFPKDFRIEVKFSRFQCSNAIL